MARSFLSVFIILAAGCSASSPSPVSLAQATRVTSAGLLHGRVESIAQGGLQQMPTPVELPVQGLDLVLKTGPRAELTSLTLPIGDVNVPASALPPRGLQLRDVMLHTDAAIAAQVVHADTDSAELVAHAPLTLAWRMLLDDGRSWALGPSRTAPLDLDLVVVRTATGYATTVTARCPGECWSLDGIASLRDGVVELVADADVRAAN